MVPFRKVKTGDKNLDDVQDNVDESLRPINLCPLLNGALVGPVTFVSGAGTRVSHGLGRKPQGWLAVSPNSSGTLWQGVSATPTLHLVMTASVNLTTSFWVF